MAKGKISDYMNQRISFKAFKDSGRYKDDIIVGVNGKNWQIKRGEEVNIPRYVFEIIKQSIAQDQYVATLIEAEASRGSKGEA
jgi:hypothetical protein